ncbi:hypothetical protein ACFYOA_08095 [Streptomyces iakyrus]|uniref:hypothetical protein n=1 Tax=Streptomyces iakyrus TaxID=68219 RepID=UPI0036AE69DF
MTYRETTVSVLGVGERTIRTEGLPPAKLDREHTKRVKAALVEMRVAAAPDSMPREMAEAQAKRATTLPKCHWAEMTRKLRPVPTTDPSTYLREVEPGHFVQD